MLVDFSDAPDDPIERLLWLSGVREQAQIELDREYQKAYFNARIQHRFGVALDLHLHSQKRALAFTRHENELRGRPVKWGDGY
jgi:hypothetical protein